MQTSGFFDHGVEERESAGIFEGCGLVGFWESGQFDEKAREVARVGEEAVEDCAEEDGSCVGAGGDVGGCPCAEGPFFHVLLSTCRKVMGKNRRIRGEREREGLTKGVNSHPSPSPL